MSLSKSVLGVLILLTLYLTGLGQYQSPPKLSGVGLPYFNAEVFPTFTKDGAQRIVRIYVQMLNDDITFIRADTGFKAEAQIDFYISGKSKDFVFNRTLNEKVWVKRFEETNSRDRINIFSTEIPMDSGKYEAVVTVLDQNTGKQVNRKVLFELPPFSRLPFLISDLLLFDNFTEDDSGRITSFIPNLTGNFSSGSDYVYLYFNTYIRERSDDTLKIRYVIRDAANYINQNNEYTLRSTDRFEEHFIRLSRHQFEGTRYSVQIDAIMGQQEYKLNKFFSFFWTVSPNSPQDLNLALRQLRYITEADSVKYYLDRPFEEKKGYFERFWAEMDPNPETTKNELMDEYYRRVNYANQTFSTLHQEGWLTDRGRIFIKFGHPDDIERHPFELNSFPYEIWRYYSLQRVFLFIDRLGFGDYELHPSYLDEEYR